MILLALSRCAQFRSRQLLLTIPSAAFAFSEQTTDTIWPYFVYPNVKRNPPKTSILRVSLFGLPRVFGKLGFWSTKQPKRLKFEHGGWQLNNSPHNSSTMSSVSTHPPHVDALPALYKSLKFAQNLADADPKAPLPLLIPEIQEKTEKNVKIGTSTGAAAGMRNKGVASEALGLYLSNLTSDSHTSAVELANLKQKLTDLTQQSTAMVKYLEGEIRRKEQQHQRLQTQLSETKQFNSTELSQLHADFQKQLAAAESSFLDKEAFLLTKQREIQEELAGYRDYAELRSKLTSNLQKTQLLIGERENLHSRQFKELEGNIGTENERLRENCARKIEQSKQFYRAELTQELQEQAISARNNNTSLSNQLYLQQQTASRLSKINGDLKGKIAAVTRDIELLQQQQLIHTKNQHKSVQSINNLTLEAKELEQNLMKLLNSLDQTRATANNNALTLIQPAQLSLLRLQQAATAQETQNSSLRRAAANLLRRKEESQRFFLEMIEECERKMREKEGGERKERQEKERKNLRALSSRDYKLNHNINIGGKFLPKISSGGNHSERNQQGESSSRSAEPVDLLDLTLQDRLRLLRILYAKITGIKLTNYEQVPSHSSPFNAAHYTEIIGNSSGSKDNNATSGNSNTASLNPLLHNIEAKSEF
jgi:hypothetical protein